MKKPTIKQESLLHFIKSYTLKNGYQPSVVEMAHHCNVKSNNAVYDRLKGLERKGVISFTGKARALKINT